MADVCGNDNSFPSEYYVSDFFLRLFARLTATELKASELPVEIEGELNPVVRGTRLLKMDRPAAHKNYTRVRKSATLIPINYES